MGGIDVHVHPVLVEEVLKEYPGLLSRVREVFGIGTAPQPLKVLLRQMEMAGVEKAVLLPVDCTTRFGVVLPPVKAVVEIARRHSEAFVPFTSVDPLRPDAKKILKEHCREYGVAGLKLNPPMQGFNPLDDRVIDLLEACADLELPVIVHTGHVWNPRDQLEYAKPILWDRVLAKVEGLRIVLAHMGFPWLWETFAVVTRHERAYADISNVFTGTPLEHLTYVLTEALPRRITERFLYSKIVFGSDYPRIEIDKMARALNKLDLDPYVKRRVFEENARRLLRL